MKRAWWAGLLLAVGIAAAGCGSGLATSSQAGGYSNNVAAVQSNTAANVDPGTLLNKTAPNFTVTDQFGQSFSLSQYRGKVVVLAFQDSQCTTICPLTSQEMVMAKHMLGAKAASEVQLLAVDANPQATSVADVRNYSVAHGVMHAVLFGTLPEPQLVKIWKNYNIYVAVLHGAIDHTPGVYIINPHGKEKRVYLTQMAYNGIGQQAQMFAQEIARLLPHPTKTSQAVLHASLVQEASIHQLASASMPAASGSGKITITDGKPHLMVFVASWLRFLSNTPAQLRALNQYQAYAKAHGLPSLIVVDERPTEPNSRAFPAVLHQTGPLHYPVGVDTTGAIAQKAGVQDLTWYALIDAHGQVIWRYDGTNHWYAPASLEQAVAHALAKHG
jgi:cytochrome oxidase Cu insertion factor (SCO1/SenC/PrrC family)